MYQAVQKRKQLRSAKGQLRHRQQLFVHHYLLCGNASKAAEKAGYANPNSGHQLIRNSKVKRYLQAQSDRLAEKFAATKERIIQELCRIAYLDPAELFDENGKLRPIHEIPPETRAAIAGVNVTKNQEGEIVSKIKLVDKTKALEMLAKYQKLFSDAPVTVNPYRGMPTAELEARLRELTIKYLLPLVKPAEGYVIDVGQKQIESEPKSKADSDG
jgi:phage terminase small subunit